jgi:hypothetical protein
MSFLVLLLRIVVVLVFRELTVLGRRLLTILACLGKTTIRGAGALGAFVSCDDVVLSPI